MLLTQNTSILSLWLGRSAIDVLINNAGTGSAGPHISSATQQQISEVFNTNCLGVFATVKGALNSLKNSKSALVVNISSRRGSLTQQASGAAKGSGCSYSYRISKAAQNMLTLCLADDLEEFGIKIAAVHPGLLLTDLASSDANMPPERSAALLGKLIVEQKIKNRDYLCMETGALAW